MRDSDMAIGGLVLLGIIGAFAYFLFPNFITGILRGPSYNDIVRAQESEIAAFNRETEVVSSYLTESWTMKIYRRIESMVGRNGYEDWIQEVKRKGTISSRRLFKTLKANGRSPIVCLDLLSRGRHPRQDKRKHLQTKQVSARFRDRGFAGGT